MRDFVITTRSHSSQQVQVGAVHDAGGGNAVDSEAERDAGAEKAVDLSPSIHIGPLTAQPLVASHNVIMSNALPLHSCICLAKVIVFPVRYHTVCLMSDS